MSNEIEYIEEEYYESVKTHFWGNFYGKYRGVVDESTVELPFETQYDIEVYEGYVNTRKTYFQKHDADKGLKKIKDLQKEPIYKATFPDIVSIIVVDTNKQFDIHVNDPRLKNIKLKNHVIENDLVFGEIEAEITGFIEHQVKKTRVVAITNEVVTDPPKLPQPGPTKPILPIEPTPPSGPIPPTGPTGTGCWETLKELVLWLIVLAIVIPLFAYGWPVLLPLIGLGLIFYLLNLIPTRTYNAIGNTLFYLFLLLLLAILLYAIIDSFNNKNTPYIPKPKKENVIRQDTIIRQEPIYIDSLEIIYDEIDTLIINEITWEDYDFYNYQGKFINKLIDINSSYTFRNTLKNNMQSTQEYNLMLKSLFIEDESKLENIYLMFDSLRQIHELDNFQFAEMVVSCIQHIPYVLLLHSDCNYQYSKDSFVKNYIDSGGECIGNIRYGIHTPVEFTSSLMGDCDTRTLLAFTILNQFGFDVAILGSELYKHSILAINLPYKGIYKEINGKKYYVWETTSIGFPPGFLDATISNMNFWNINIKN